MPRDLSTTSIPWLVARSGGSLPIPLGTHSAPENWRPIQTEAPDWELPSKRVFQWSTVDQTTDGKVQFWTTIDIDAATPADVSQDAWRRMLCFYFVGRLSGDALYDAYQTLADIFSWQIERTLPVRQIPDQTRHAVSKVRRVERVPFDFDED